MSAILLYKDNSFVGLFPKDEAFFQIHKGERTMTVAQAVAEGWEMKLKPNTNKGKR